MGCAVVGGWIQSIRRRASEFLSAPLAEPPLSGAGRPPEFLTGSGLYHANVGTVDHAVRVYVGSEVHVRDGLARLGLGLADIGCVNESVPISIAQKKTRADGRVRKCLSEIIGYIAE